MRWLLIIGWIIFFYTKKFWGKKNIIGYYYRNNFKYKLIYFELNWWQILWY